MGKGLDYGNRYRKKTNISEEEGVYFIESSNKWIVRVKKKCVIISLTQKQNKEEAHKIYREYKEEEKLKNS